ncbi:melanoma-associated antigen 10-like [Nycticebus coucang]|uniref:melanoma-associated antigen 10-like n=1 Tax=Nycticebus coucang TaxID=9470 RepID=UPI00234CD9A9|nr:melanoma-associated antigen 10-like [Nycticebus coucang]
MPPPEKRRRCEEGSPTESEMQSFGGPRITVEEETSSSSSTCSSSFPLSFPSSSSSTSSSYYPLMSSTPEEISDAAGTSSPSQSPQAAGLPTPLITSTPVSESDAGSSSQQQESPGPSQALADIQPLSRNEIDEKVADLVAFLLSKYRNKELFTEAEMLTVVFKNDKDHFPLIFSEASECMQIVFGIQVKEMDPTERSFILVTNLGLTYDGMLNDVESMPKTGILILILSIIFLEGNCASEEVIWETLNVLGLYAGMEHFIYGEPQKLLTHDWVHEKYLVYRQVPHSDPVRHEFLWGPRAHAETSKMNLLQFLAKVHGSDPRSFPVWYEEALREERERAKARISPSDDTDMASASPGATCSSYSN